MEHYDENMNYTFEPETPAPQPPKKKKSGGTGKWIALIIVAALVAGVGGSLITKAITDVSEKNSLHQTEKQKKTDEVPNTADEQTEDVFNDEQWDAHLEHEKLPETFKSYDGDKSLTPQQVYEMNVGAVVGIRTESSMNVWGQATTSSSSGTGFVVTEDGYIVTNSHVVEGGQKFTVVMYDETEHEAEVIANDSINDVALVKIDAEGLQTVAIGDSSELVVGEQVIAIGNPLGELTFTMTQGYISALDREINTSGTPINMLQTDAAINPGNSGGPLFDMNGNVIAVTTAKPATNAATGTTIEGIGFAIPINDVMRIAYDMLENGKVTGRAYLGISVKDLDAETAKSYSLPLGVYVAEVVEDHCAQKAGLEVGDIILEVDGQKTECTTDLLALMNRHRAGDEVTLKLYRKGEELEKKMTLDEKPEEEPQTEQQLPQQQLPEQGGQMPDFGQYGIPDDLFRYFMFG